MANCSYCNGEGILKSNDFARGHWDTSERCFIETCGRCGGSGKGCEGTYQWYGTESVMCTECGNIQPDGKNWIACRCIRR